MLQTTRGPIDGNSIASIDEHLEILAKVMFWQVFELIYECAARREQCPSMDTESVDRGLDFEVYILLHNLT